MSVALEKERKMGLETTVLEREYKLPTGETIYIGNERFEATEILMNPERYDPEMYDDLGLAGMIYDSICRCDMDL
jgi:actin-related protein 2